MVGGDGGSVVGGTVTGGSVVGGTVVGGSVVGGTVVGGRVVGGTVVGGRVVGGAVTGGRVVGGVVAGGRVVGGVVAGGRVVGGADAGRVVGGAGDVPGGEVGAGAPEAGGEVGGGVDVDAPVSAASNNAVSAEPFAATFLPLAFLPGTVVAPSTFVSERRAGSVTTAESSINVGASTAPAVAGVVSSTDADVPGSTSRRGLADVLAPSALDTVSFVTTRSRPPSPPPVKMTTTAITTADAKPRLLSRWPAPYPAHAASPRSRADRTLRTASAGA